LLYNYNITKPNNKIIYAYIFYNFNINFNKINFIITFNFFYYHKKKCYLFHIRGVGLGVEGGE